MSISKAALNKFHVFCQEKLQKVLESAKTKHNMKKKNTRLLFKCSNFPKTLVIVVFFFLSKDTKRYEHADRKH